MKKNKRKIGTCHLCGYYGELSFEHTPNRKAFNDKRVVTLSLKEAISLGPNAIPKGRVQQKGSGAYVLCERCNHLTGHWYGSQFVRWCYDAMSVLINADRKPTLYYPFLLYPLPVIKQIITMFFSANGDRLGACNPELKKFVLHKNEKYLPPKYRFFISYNVSRKAGLFPLSAKVNIVKHKHQLFTEIAYPPFIYIMTVDSDSIDQRLEEITYFTRFNYNELAIVNLRIPILPVENWIPGDFRTKDEMQQPEDWILLTRTES